MIKNTKCRVCKKEVPAEGEITSKETSKGTKYLFRGTCPDCGLSITRLTKKEEYDNQKGPLHQDEITTQTTETEQATEITETEKPVETPDIFVEETKPETNPAPPLLNEEKTLPPPPPAPLDNRVERILAEGYIDGTPVNNFDESVEVLDSKDKRIQ